MARGNPSSSFPRSLKPAERGLMGCAGGYAGQLLGPSERPLAGEVTTWLP